MSYKSGEVYKYINEDYHHSVTHNIKIDEIPNVHVKIGFVSTGRYSVYGFIDLNGVKEEFPIDFFIFDAHVTAILSQRLFMLDIDFKSLLWQNIIHQCNSKTQSRYGHSVKDYYATRYDAAIVINDVYKINIVKHSENIYPKELVVKEEKPKVKKEELFNYVGIKELKNKKGRKK